MKKLTSLLLIGVLSLCSVLAYANAPKFVAFEKGSDRTVIADGSKLATIVIDNEKDWPGVVLAANTLAEDFNRVTGKTPKVSSEVSASSPAIIIGTLGKSGIIDSYLTEEDIEALDGKNEKYILKTTDGNVIIAGSDKRGTTYGIYALSAQIGVSPWYWWADVPSEQHDELYVINGNYTEGEPGVKLRGIFLNDEAPALTGWVNENTDGYTHKFYVRVFELLLRLKANFMWPAMWDAAFYDDDPMNMYYADMMGIMMGTSHHEPCSRAQKEWHRYGEGAWDYTKNKDVLMDFWKEGIERMKDTEDIVTIGMRGDGDMAMSEDTNIDLLEEIIEDQRKMIAKVTGKPASKTPQVWALYKEVQDYYDKGMRVPDDVTLLLCDDNWGNVRKLPLLTDKPRSGGYGMYYHFDYVGGPRNYKWLNTNQIQRIWEQMNLCWEYGVRQLWVVNVGDLKPMEYPIQFFLDMAWNPEAYNPENLLDHTIKFAEDCFGEENAEEIGEILDLYGKYSRRVTPELLDANTYSFAYDEWPTVVAEWKELELRALRVYQDLDPKFYDSYEQLVLFPIQAIGNVYEMYYAVAMNDKATNVVEINYWADKVEELYKKDSLLCWHYNHEIADGKWNHMMDQTHIGYTMWQQPNVQTMPKVRRVMGTSPLCHKEADGYVSIEANNFKKNEGVTVIDNLGKTNCGLTTLPAKETPQNAYVEYEIETTSSGRAFVNVLLAPTLNFNQNKGLRYAISVDGGPEQIVNFNGRYRGELGEWQANSIINSYAFLNIDKPGRHTIRFRFVDPGIVLQKILVNFGGLQQTYLGAPSSELIN